MAESPATSSYPGTIDTWVDLTDKEDLAEVSDINKLKAAVEAVQTELGTNPAGSKTDLVARLAVLMEDNGALNQGTSYPGSPVDGQFFYRTDLDTAAIYNGSGWDSLGQSLSNVIFCWSGVSVYSSNAYGMNVEADATYPNSTRSLFIALPMVKGTTYITIFAFRYVHIAGISNINIYSNLIRSNLTAYCNVDIGGQNNSVSTSSNGWATTSAINVSGLSVGTSYEGIIQLKNSGSSDNTWLKSISLIAS